MRIFWHRRDPRLVDNRGLSAAASGGDVLPVFVYDPDVLRLLGKRQRALVFRGYRQLKAEYRERGSDLLVRKGKTADVLADVSAEYDADVVYYNRLYHPTRRNRETHVDRALSTESFTDLALVSPGRLDDEYPNHGAFYRDWQREHTLPPYGSVDGDDLVAISDNTTLPAPDVDIELPEASHAAARRRLDGFLDAGIRSYDDDRDDLAKAAGDETSTSRMSVYLNTGLIGVREVWAAASDQYELATGDARSNVDKYRYELSWREQMIHLLYHNPDLLSAPYVDFERPVEWRTGEAANAAFHAWQRGETGYPLVDAGMRQLAAEGYMHNRTRQNAASFLTKHLLIDWRAGAKHFMKQLLDYDPAVNYGSWQWTASTGTDSVDVRIFDPVSQLRKYDDGARYVRRYVPELSEVPTDAIVDWPTLSERERAEYGIEYPGPIIGRNDGWNRAERAFETALGKR